MYYPGNTCEKTFLKDYKSQLEKQRDRHAVVLGDFNINLLDIDKSEDYQKVVNDTGFTVLNNKSQEYFTRKDIKNNTEKKISIIDHVSSNLDAGDYHFALIDSSLADHRQLYIEIRNPELLPNNPGSSETIKKSPRKCLLPLKNNAPLEDSMIQIINQIERKQLTQDDWITEKICKGIALRNLLHQKYQRNPNSETRKQFDRANKKGYEEREVKKTSIRSSLSLKMDSIKKPCLQNFLLTLKLLMIVKKYVNNLIFISQKLLVSTITRITITYLQKLLRASKKIIS